MLTKHTHTDTHTLVHGFSHDPETLSELLPGMEGSSPRWFMGSMSALPGESPSGLNGSVKNM